VQRFGAFGSNYRCDRKVLKKEVNINIKMIIYKTVYPPMLLYVSESWPLSIRAESGFGGAEMRYCSRQEETE
jgi:hypothetical protein